jgi:hypothetical protein
VSVAKDTGSGARGGTDSERGRMAQHEPSRSHLRDNVPK